ncbi:MAG: hypothetical protein SH821_08880 [Phototrophicales bacterium]|nr:hypothetical protein [Phototrophicales bacterium]
MMCGNLERNEICYGNFNLSATPQDGVGSFYFDRVGDKVSVNDLSTLELSPMNESTGEWGVAVMLLQANLPNTLPGQNVTIILFGNVTIQNVTTQEQVENGEFSPMQAFYLTTGIGDSNCAEAPESGMLVQTPKGVGEVNFMVNGVEVAMGSTVMFQAPTDNQLNATTIEGVAVLKVDDASYPVLAGTTFGVQRLPENIRFIPIPNLPDAYALETVQSLPLSLLARPIDIALPLDKTALAELQNRIDNGLPLCGTPPFPPCNELPASLGGQMCVFPENYENNLVPLEVAQNPICEASAFYGRPAPEETSPAPTNHNNDDDDD